MLVDKEPLRSCFTARDGVTVYRVRAGSRTMDPSRYPTMSRPCIVECLVYTTLFQLEYIED